MKKVILVDDNSLAMEGIQSAIDWKAAGTEVVATCCDGQSVLEYLQTGEASLIISDIQMPGMSGLEMARTVLETAPNTKIILVSAYDDFEYAREAVRIGAFDYVEKPIDYTYLTQVIHKAVACIDHELYNQALLERSRPALVAGFFRDLLHTRPEESRYDLADVVTYLEIPVDYSCYGCFHIEVSNDMEVRKSIGIQRFHIRMMELKDTLADLLGELPFFYFLDERSSITTVVGCDHTPVAAIELINQKLGQLLEGPGPFRLNIGIGRIQGSLWSLQAAYTDALRALKYRYYLPQNDLFDIRDFLDTQPQEVLLTAANEDTLIRLLTQRDLAGIRVYFDMLAQKLTENYPDKNSIIMFSYDMVGKVLRFTFDLGLQSDNLQGRVQAFNHKLAEFSSIQELCEDMCHISEAACSELENSSESYHRQLNRRILDYIRENFSDHNLGLGSIARYVNISSTHLSALFKKMNGVGLAEAITDTRMAAAEKLLGSSPLSIKEISERVGYANQYYFSASFKKRTGRTPSQYRDALVNGG